MTNATTTDVMQCVVYTPYNSSDTTSYPVQLTYVINGVVTLFLTPPAVGLNVVVIVKYLHLPRHEKQHNSKFFILVSCQLTRMLFCIFWGFNDEYLYIHQSGFSVILFLIIFVFLLYLKKNYQSFVIQRNIWCLIRSNNGLSWIL